MIKLRAALVVSLSLFLVSVTSGLGQSQWLVRPSNTSASLNGVVFANGLFVAVGDNGAIVTSPDGEGWTPRASGTTDQLRAIAFGNGRFVATRVNRSIPAITSTDGINWAPVTLSDSNGATATSGAWDSIAFGGGRFMAVGAVGSALNSTEIMTSTDGISFQTVKYARYPAPSYLIEALKTILFFQGRYYASAGYDGIWSSSNGIEWRQEAAWGGAGLLSGTASVATDGFSKVTVLGSSNPGFSIDAGHTFLRSVAPADRYSLTLPSPTIAATCFGAGGFVAVDAQGRIWKSERGEYWQPVGSYAKAGEGFHAVTYDGSGRFVAVGSAPSSGSALIAVAAADAAPPPPAYTIYRLKDLSNGVFNGEPRSISNSGIIGGTITGADKKTTGATLRDGAVTTYPDPIFGSAQTTVTSVNDNGFAALELGVTSKIGVAVPQNVRTFPGVGVSSTAPSINSNGSIVGVYQTSTGKGVYRFDGATGATTDLGDFGLGNVVHATSINDRGDIAGIYAYGFDSKTLNNLWRPYRRSADGQLTLVPTLGGEFSYDVVMNSAGDVAGAASLPSAPTIVNATHAFLYRNGVTSDIDLFNSRFSTVNGINNRGDVVGEFTPANYEVWQGVGGNAFLYRNGVMYDLNRLLDASGDGWVLYRATSINDTGAIVGQGWFHGPNLEPFLAVPAQGSPAGVQTRFVNLSTRLRTSTGDDALIAGFVLRGGPKHLILRALGPALINGGPPNLLADPTLELFNDRGERVAFNDNFSDLPYFPDQNEIGLYGLRPPYGGTVTPDSVIAVTLSEGSYTAVVRGKGGTSGNALVEVYNVDTDYSSGLLNISTRGPVGTNDDVMIAGFIVRGDRERHILVRGIGPSLAQAGVTNPLADPTLEIHDANGQIAQNDDWKSDQENEIRAAGFAPRDDRDAAVILSLWPGSYTAIVRGKGGGTGNALVEVYALP